MKMILAIFFALLFTSPLGAADMEAIKADIFKAIERKDCKKLEKILKSNVDIDLFLNSDDAKTKAGLNPLLYAVRKNSPKMVALLLSYGADPNIAEDMTLKKREMTKHNGLITTLTVAGVGTNPTVLSIDDMSDNGDTALHFAVINKNSAIISLLLSHGANPNLIDSDNSDNSDDSDDSDDRTPPLFFAIENGYLEGVRLLLIAGRADPNFPCGSETHLTSAIKKRDVETIELLLESGADPDEPNTENIAPLHLAAKSSDFWMVKLLLKYRADVNVKNNFGSTLLHLAAKNGDFWMVTFLLKYGANVNVKDHYGSTPLHLAIDCDDFWMIKRLLKHGADVNAEDNSDYTPLHLAAKKGDLLMVKLLLKYGADVNVKDHYSYTPLHLVIDCDDFSMVKLLIEYGADVNAEDNSGSTPLRYAALVGSKKIIAILLLNGADARITDTNDRSQLQRDVFYGTASRSKKFKNIFNWLVKAQEKIGRVETYDSRVRQVLSEDDLFDHLFENLTAEAGEGLFFPNEIWSMIREFLPPGDLWALGLVNKCLFTAFSLDDDLRHRISELPIHQVISFLKAFAPEHLPKIKIQKIRAPKSKRSKG